MQLLLELGARLKCFASQDYTDYQQVVSATRGSRKDHVRWPENSIQIDLSTQKQQHSGP